MTDPILAGPSEPTPVHPAPHDAPPPAGPAWGLPPAGLAVPVGPVAPMTARPSRRPSPLRWVVALLVVALVVSGGLGATLLLTGSSSGASDLAGFVPTDTLTYAEGRLDLPGSQRAEVAKTFAAFPGFADQASLDAKLGEVYDRIVRAASSSKHDYQTEIAPWFGGQLAYSVGPGTPLRAMDGQVSPQASPATSPTAGLPACTGGDAAAPTPAASASDPSSLGERASSVSIRVLILASVKDPAKAEAWVGSILGGGQVQTTDRTCDGVTVHLVRRDGVGFKAPDMGWAILGGKALVAGDLDSIRLAIATKGTTGLGATAAFTKAVSSIGGDHVGFVYEAVRAMFDLQVKAMAAADTEGTATAAANLIAARLPEWIAGDLRAADGNIVIDSAAPMPDGAPATTNRASDLAGLVPSGTLALVDVHDVGTALATLRASLASEPKFQASVKQFDQVVGLIGGFDSAVGWIRDAGVALTRSGSSVTGGILIRPADGSAAQHLATQIRSLADLSGVTSGVKISDEPYKGATITTVDLSSVTPALTSGMGSRALGQSLPSDLKLVYAVTDKVVVFSLDASFVKSVVDASQGGPSLAGDSRFSALLGKAGDKVTGLVWVDVAASRDLIEGLMPSDARAKYERDVKPYLLPFDALISNGTSDNGLYRGTTILSIKH